MSDYSEMSIEDLEKLKENLLSQRSNLDNTIEDIVNSIKSKKLQIGDMNLKRNPYYKDDTSYLKVTINDGAGYTVTKVTPRGKCKGIYQFYSDTIDFLRYYKICATSEWNSVLDGLNVWFKDSGLRIEKL